MDVEVSMRFLSETAVYMQKDRPDLYPNVTDALETLSNAVEYLRQVEGGSYLSFASYVLVKFYDDGVTEFILSRKISSLCDFEPESESYTAGHIENVNLPPLDSDLNT